MIIRRVATATIIGATTSLVPSKARSHDWYPKECCMAVDCSPAPGSHFKAVGGGWRVLETGEIIPYSKVRRSPDGRFHRCIVDFWEPKSATRCLFVPDSGS